MPVIKAAQGDFRWFLIYRFLYSYDVFYTIPDEIISSLSPQIEYWRWKDRISDPIPQNSRSVCSLSCHPSNVQSKIVICCQWRLLLLWYLNNLPKSHPTISFRLRYELFFRSIALGKFAYLHGLQWVSWATYLGKVLMISIGGFPRMWKVVQLSFLDLCICVQWMKFDFL